MDRLTPEELREAIGSSVGNEEQLAAAVIELARALVPKSKTARCRCGYNDWLEEHRPGCRVHWARSLIEVTDADRFTLGWSVRADDPRGEE